MIVVRARNSAVTPQGEGARSGVPNFLTFFQSAGLMPVGSCLVRSGVERETLNQRSRSLWRSRRAWFTAEDLAGRINALANVSIVDKRGGAGDCFFLFFGLERVKDFKESNTLKKIKGGEGW